MPPLRLRSYSLVLAVSLGLFTALDVLYLLWLGMTWVQVGTLAAIFNIVVLVAELPSSILADIMSPKAALVTGLAARCGGLVVFSTASGFWSAAAAEALTGLGTALASGSFDKILVANLKTRDEGTISDAYGVISRLSAFGSAVGVVVGVGLFHWHPRASWATAACGVLMCIILATTMRAPRRDHGVPTVRNVLTHTVSSLRSSMLWVSVIAASSGVAPYLLWQRLVSTDGLTAVAAVGVLIAGAGWVGARLASARLGRSLPLEVIVLANAATVMALGWIGPVVAVGAVFLAHVALQTLTGIRVYGMFQASIKDSFRASVTSLSSLGDSALAALGSFATGAVMAGYGTRWAMMVSVCLYVLLIGMLLARRPAGGGNTGGAA